MSKDSRRPLTEDEMAGRVAREIKDGDCINLGAGMPFRVSQKIKDRDSAHFGDQAASLPASHYIPNDIWAMVMIEHGILGIGGAATGTFQDRDLMGLGRSHLTAVPGASCFSSSEAFTMLRGGHINLSVLGAFQVSEKGDLANWLIPGDCPNIGGSMDIVGHVKRLIVMMTHVTKKGEPKIVKRCTLPVTGYGVTDMIVTDMAVIEVKPEGLVLLEVPPGFTPEDIQAITEPRLIISPKLKDISP
jgi:3-oxoacid CoA-transferase subunit B